MSDVAPDSKTLLLCNVIGQKTRASTGIQATAIQQPRFSTLKTTPVRMTSQESVVLESDAAPAEFRRRWEPHSRPHYDTLVKGFNAVTVAGAFIGAIQAQLMSTTIATPVGGETVALGAINALYLSGLVLDILSALLAFLTARWLELLTEKEKGLLEEKFSQTLSKQHRSLRELLLYTWLGQSLFMPMPLLILGVACMITGIYVYVWTQRSLIVAAPVTLAGTATLPFVFGDFFIGKNQEKREKLITRLSEMRGDW